MFPNSLDDSRVFFERAAQCVALFVSDKCLLQGMFGPSGRKSQIFVVHRLAAVRLGTPIQPTGLFTSTKSSVCLRQGMFGSSSPRVVSLGRSTGVERCSPKPRSHPTGLSSPSTAPRAETKKGRPMDDPSLFGSACWARTSDPMINSHLLYQLS